MIVISNSSPLIALSRINCLHLFKSIFGEVLIPDSVYLETVVQANLEIQHDNINKAVEDGFIKVKHSTKSQSFARNLGLGEKGVLDLAADINPSDIKLHSSNQFSLMRFQPLMDTLINKCLENICPF